MQRKRTLTDRSLAILGLLISVALLLGGASRTFASGGQLGTRYDLLSDDTVSAVAIHKIGFTINDTTQPVGSILIEFCQNTPIIGDTCTVPGGFDASGAVLSAQQGETGFTIDASSTANRIILTRPAVLPAGGPVAYTFTNVINPSTSGSYYVRLQTFTSTDASGANIEQGGIAIAIRQALTVKAEVPPYLKFCAAITITNFDCTTATSFLMNLGELETTRANTGSSQFVVATNASSGYSVTLSGTTLTSGNNIVPPLATNTTSKPGESQFGLNLRGNTDPTAGSDPLGPGSGVVMPGYATPNSFRFHNGDVLVSSPGSSDNNKFTVTYLTNVSTSQPAGFYATTLTYICLANF